MELADHTVNQIRDLKPLRNVTELKSFLELCNVYRRSVLKLKLAGMPTTLTKKLEKSEPKTLYTRTKKLATH